MTLWLKVEDNEFNDVVFFLCSLAESWKSFTKIYCGVDFNSRFFETKGTLAKYAIKDKKPRQFGWKLSHYYHAHMKELNLKPQRMKEFISDLVRWVDEFMPKFEPFIMQINNNDSHIFPTQINM